MKCALHNLQSRAVEYLFPFFSASLGLLVEIKLTITRSEGYARKIVLYINFSVKHKLYTRKNICIFVRSSIKILELLILPFISQLYKIFVPNRKYYFVLF